MRKSWLLVFAAAVVALRLAAAGEGRPGREGREAQAQARPVARARGVAQSGMQHHLVREAGKPAVHMQVYHDARGIGAIRRDPHMVKFDHRNYHVVGHWDHWNRDWGLFWRVQDWGVIRSVTCEAVDNTDGALFPVTETRLDNAWGWDSNAVGVVASRALDECLAESGNPDHCSLVQAECWHSTY